MSELSKDIPEKLKPYYTKGLAMIQKNGEGYVIKPATEEWREWERYFSRYVGQKPWTVIAGRETTVPTQWPQWFDNSFAE